MGKASLSCLKVKSYYKRYQVKFKRRRQGKTNYHKRRKMLRRDKCKYETPKYRMVVRKTNTKIIAQIIYATLTGDRVVSHADSGELPRYGVKLGLTNYPAAYCTGLLLARRTLKVFEMEEMFEGMTEVTGEYHENEPEDDDGRNPFTAYLDVGLTRTTTGNNVFGCLKGAVDGGLNIPHSERRFPGWDAEANEGDGDYNPEVHRDRIFGKPLGEYMELLKSEDEERYKKQFSRYIKEGINPEDLEDIYLKAHEAIRADPMKKDKKEKTGKNYDGEFKRPKKLTLEQRRENVKKKIAALQEKAAKAMEEDDD